MSIYISSDYHLGHDNIRKYTKRPFSSVEEMNEKIINNHNSRVKDGDYFIHNGDFCFYSANSKGNGSHIKAEEYLKKLKGVPILIQGNHDKNNSVNTKIHNLVLGASDIQIKVTHKPIHSDPTYPLNIVGHIHTAWKTISFLEYYRIQKKELSRKDLPKKYLESVKQFINKWNNNSKNSLLLNVGVDVHNFYPLSLQEILVFYYRWKKEQRG